MSQSQYTMADLLAIMAQLREPQNGCPWDIAQDFSTIAPYTLEEAYEVADAIERQQWQELPGELGDLLFQVVFHAQMGQEAQLFDFNTVVDSICHKMIRRHPHVFSDQSFSTEEEVLANWEEEKQKERREQGNQDSSILDAVTLGLPALKRAVKLQKKAAKVGFDWPEAEPIFDKIQEEIEEVREELAAESLNPQALQEEIGDLLFAVVNLARHYRVDPEQALRGANQKFCKRFHYIEQKLQSQGETLEGASLSQMDDLWNEAKGAQLSNVLQRSKLSKDL